MTSHRITRRRFLQSTSISAAVLAFPTVVPFRVLGKDAPSNQLRMGSIGTGREGHADLRQCLYQGLEPGGNARLVAVCDLDSHRAENAKQVIEKTYRQKLGAGHYEPVKVYGDFRELLARPDIDGVTISTPDFWHALVAIAAAEAGKDMYLQKPLTYSIAEGEKLVAAVRKHKVVLQTGSQQRSSLFFRKTCELVRNGHLGRLQTIEVVIPTDHGRGDPTPMPVPENLNYEMWLGPTPEAPYTQDRVHPQKGYGRPGWLQIERYCRGMITGWGAHMYDVAQWALGTDHDSGPIQVQATAEFPHRGLFNVHTSYHARALYGDVPALQANGVELVSHNGSPAVKFTGEKGWVKVWRYSFQSDPDDLVRETIGPDEVHLYRSRNHMMDFLECMRSRKDPAAPVEVGHRSNSVCVIHHVAMKLGRTLHWDPKTQRFLHDDEANSFLDYPHRQPWTV